jgi:hypothetical protein
MAFTDREVTTAIATLDRLLAAEKDRFRGAPRQHGAWNFARHLQGGQLTTAQESQVLKHLDVLSPPIPTRFRPHAGAVMISQLMVEDGSGHRRQGPRRCGIPLRDYRGKVVADVFWLNGGICRTLHCTSVSC